MSLHRWMMTACSQCLTNNQLKHELSPQTSPLHYIKHSNLVRLPFRCFLACQGDTWKLNHAFVKKELQNYENKTKMRSEIFHTFQCTVMTKLFLAEGQHITPLFLVSKVVGFIAFQPCVIIYWSNLLK